MAHEWATLKVLANAEPSLSRDALVRTLFLKTSPKAYENDPPLAFRMASLMASTTGDSLDEQQQLRASQAMARQLGTESRRALFVDPAIQPNTRLWAAEQLMGDPVATEAVIGTTDKPWEDESVLEWHAAARMQQHAIGRGDLAIDVTGYQIQNLIGTSAGAAMRFGGLCRYTLSDSLHQEESYARPSSSRNFASVATRALVSASSSRCPKCCSIAFA